MTTAAPSTAPMTAGDPIRARSDWRGSESDAASAAGGGAGCAVLPAASTVAAGVSRPATTVASAEGASADLIAVASSRPVAYRSSFDLAIAFAITSSIACGNSGTLLGRLRRGLEEVRVHHRDLRVLVVRRRSGQALVEHATEGIDVGARVERLALELLGRRVLRRPDEHARLRQSACALVLGDAEVREVDVVRAFGSGPRGDQDVRRLHVAMDEAPRVSAVESSSDLRHQRRHLVQRQRSIALQASLEVGALDVAHGDEQDPVLVTGLEDRDHVRMVEPRSELRLPREPIAERGVSAELGREQLERDSPAELKVMSPVDDAHAAVADQRVEAISPEVSSDRGNHVTSLTEQFYRVHPRSPNGEADLDGFLTIEAAVL